MRIYKKSSKQATDIALALLVLMGAVSAAWLGLTGVKDVPVSAALASETPSASDEGLFTVVIDAGHGGFDPGAIGAQAGAVEAKLNLSVAELLKEKLEKAGLRVIMTRNDDGALGETKDEDMRERKRIMQDESVDIVVSVHMNKFRDSTVSGPMVFYMKGSDEGRALAECVIAGVCESTGRPPRRANPEDLFVLRVPTAPSILVECGFLSNASDEAQLMTRDYRERIADGIASGIGAWAARIKSGDSE